MKSHTYQYTSGEMKRIHQKSQNTEKRKIQFFSRILTDFVDVVANKDLASFYSQIRFVYEYFIQTIDRNLYRFCG